MPSPSEFFVKDQCFSYKAHLHKGGAEQYHRRERINLLEEVSELGQSALRHVDDIAGLELVVGSTLLNIVLQIDNLLCVLAWTGQHDLPWLRIVVRSARTRERLKEGHIRGQCIRPRILNLSHHVDECIVGVWYE